MTGLTVNELVDLLAMEIAAGRGDYEVFVVNYAAGVLGEPIDDLLGCHNWEVRHVGVPDHPADTFITLGAYPEDDR